MLNVKSVPVGTGTGTYLSNLFYKITSKNYVSPKLVKTQLSLSQNNFSVIETHLTVA